MDSYLQYLFLGGALTYDCITANILLLVNKFANPVSGHPSN